MNRKQVIAAIRAIAPELTARFVEGEYRVSINPAAIRAAYPDLTVRESNDRAESIAAYDSDGESALANARHIWAAWQAETISETPAPANPVKVNLRRQAAAMSEIADSENAATAALHIKLSKPGEIRRDNVEYHAGRRAFERGEPESACPYYASDRFGADARHARWTLGWREARDSVPAPDAASVIGEHGTRAGVTRIDVTPTWAAIMPLLRAAVENGTATGRAMAWAEFERMAVAADTWNRMAMPCVELATASRAILRESTPGTRCALRVALDSVDSLTNEESN